VTPSQRLSGPAHGRASYWLLHQYHSPQLAFEFGERLAAIRSPLEIFGVVAEFTGKRIAMFGKYSKEMAELPIGR
jgi:hypothetical protein